MKVGAEAGFALGTQQGVEAGILPRPSSTRAEQGSPTAILKSA